MQLPAYVPRYLKQSRDSVFYKADRGRYPAAKKQVFFSFSQFSKIREQVLKFLLPSSLKMLLNKAELPKESRNVTASSHPRTNEIRFAVSPSCQARGKQGGLNAFLNKLIFL
jgi:hypothetical protein